MMNPNTTGVSYAIGQTTDPKTGAPVEAVLKYTGNEPDVITTIPELEELFDTCCERWGEGNWDLDKVLLAIREADFD